jgi:hypothetical protein
MTDWHAVLTAFSLILGMIAGIGGLVFMAIKIADRRIHKEMERHARAMDGIAANRAAFQQAFPKGRAYPRGDFVDRFAQEHAPPEPTGGPPADKHDGLMGEGESPEARALWKLADLEAKNRAIDAHNIHTPYADLSPEGKIVRDEIGRRLTQRMKDPEFAQWVAEGIALMSQGFPVSHWRKAPEEKTPL